MFLAAWFGCRIINVLGYPIHLWNRVCQVYPYEMLAVTHRVKVKLPRDVDRTRLEVSADPLRREIPQKCLRTSYTSISVLPLPPSEALISRGLPDGFRYDPGSVRPPGPLEEERHEEEGTPFLDGQEKKKSTKQQQQQQHHLSSQPPRQEKSNHHRPI